MHGIESIRQPYGFGSFVSKAFKKVGKGIKKVIKSPIGKAALLGLGAYYAPGLMGKSGWTGGANPLFAGGGKGAMWAKLFGTPASQLGPQSIAAKPGILSGAMKFIGKNKLPLAIAGGVGLGTAAMAGKEGEEEIDETIMSGKGHEDYLKMRKLWDWGGEEPMFSAAEGGRVHAQQGLLATPQYGQMMEDPMSSGQGGTPNMAGLIRDEETTGQATQQTADAELIQIIKMLASMGIPMEQLRGRSKQELVELMISVSGKGGEEQEIVEQAAEGGRVGLRGCGDDSIFIDESMEVLRGGEDGDVEIQENMEEIEGQRAGPEWFTQRVQDLMQFEGLSYEEASAQAYEEGPGGGAMAQGGLTRTGYAMGTEHPIIPSKDGKQLDMRDTGGYQPHGAKEKHDDVRALLAQGEFVMTSDAVKGMGGGDREEGAKKMYNLMHNMEAMA